MVLVLVTASAIDVAKYDAGRFWTVKFSLFFLIVASTRPQVLPVGRVEFGSRPTSASCQNQFLLPVSKLNVP